MTPMFKVSDSNQAKLSVSDKGWPCLKPGHYATRVTSSSCFSEIMSANYYIGMREVNSLFK